MRPRAAYTTNEVVLDKLVAERKIKAVLRGLKKASNTDQENAIMDRNPGIFGADVTDPLPSIFRS